MSWITIDILQDPLRQPCLHIFPFLEGTDLVAHDALQIVSKAAGGKQIRQARGEIGVRRRIGVLIFEGFLQRLRTDESCGIGILPMQNGHEAILRQLCFTPIGNGNFRRTFHVHAAIVGGKRMTRQTFHRAAGLDAANPSAPAIQLEGAVDVHRHCVGGICPGIFGMITTFGHFFEGKIFNRIGLGTIRQSRQETRHCQSDVARIVRLAQRTPRRVFRAGENLGEIARVGELLPRLKLHD